MKNETRIYWLFFILLAGIFWTLNFVSTTDGPGHLGMVEIWKNYDINPIYQHYYEKESMLGGYRLVYWLFLLFEHFVSPETVEKIITTITILGFGWAVDFTIQSIAPQQRWTRFFFPILAIHVTMIVGFYNHCLGLILCFASIGMWHRHEKDPFYKKIFLYALLFIALYSIHIFVAIFALILHGTLFFSRGLQDKRFKACVLDGLCVVAGFLPTLLMILHDQSNIERGVIMIDTMNQTLRSMVKLVDIFSIAPIILLDPEERYFFMVLGVLIAVYAVVKIFQDATKKTKIMLWPFLIFLTAYLVTPWFKLNIPFLPERFLYPTLVMFFFIFCTFKYQAQEKKFVTIALMVITSVVIVGRFVQLQKMDRIVTEITSLEDHIQPYSTVLLMKEGPFLKDSKFLGSAQVPFHHIDTRLTYRRQSISLSLWRAPYKHLPVRYREELNPYIYLTNGGSLEYSLEDMAPKIDLDNFAKAGGHVDYILKMGYMPPEWQFGGLKRQSAAHDQEILRTKFKLVATSKNGYASLYQSTY